ncbi:CIC11C00000001275 [Sungouiella intermedia]|uniref:CIC11C00000001275 n=1 Tax=Sungouiella intermedia TaxID=45354 RepID=A0A1L0BMA5_9ASCO|nr:CIC11C00000001275 [[Candida] intermedia]
MVIIVPENNKQASVSTTTFGDAAENTPALQDTLRAQQGPLNIASQLNNRHPLEGRVQNWEETQQNTRLEMYRRVFGAGEPIKRSMELNIIDATDFKPLVLGGPDSMHRDILLNRDATVDWEDVYKGGFDSGRHVADFHSEMERRVGI